MADLISARELKAALSGKNPPLVLDLRDEDDFDAGHIPGAIRIDEENLLAAFFKIPGKPQGGKSLWNGEKEQEPGRRGKSRDAVLVCYRGPGSIHAARRLAAYGIHARALCGGMAAWEKLGEGSAD